MEDTHPEAARVQIELVRSRSMAWRWERVRSLTMSAVELSRRGLRRHHPEMSEDELKVRWVELHYGSELARGFEEDLWARRDAREQPRS